MQVRMSVARCCCDSCAPIINALPVEIDTESFFEPFDSLDSEWVEHLPNNWNINGGRCEFDNSDTGNFGVSGALYRYHDARTLTSISNEIDLHIEEPNTRQTNNAYLRLYTPNTSEFIGAGITYQISCTHVVVGGIGPPSDVSMVEQFTYFDYQGNGTSIWTNSILTVGNSASYDRSPKIELTRAAAGDYTFDFEVFLGGVSKGTGTFDILRSGSDSMNPKPPCIFKSQFGFSTAFGWEPLLWPGNSNIQPWADNFEMMMA